MLSLTSIWNGVFNIIVYIDRGKLRKCEGWRKGDKWAGELESGRAIEGAGERKRHAEEEENVQSTEITRGRRETRRMQIWLDCLNGPPFNIKTILSIG